ncbi:hypothetical protein J3458_022211 [Metarhizium acridum]|uniref:uncharacterized protein n=1 Tax=Metarhizium acridum TaxID=92637 RepID=UPI001C6C612E|nr:hypothetical protein J3458_022211 [Metarhizium acridum]
MHFDVALAARLVAYQRTRRFILVPTTTPLPIFSPMVGSSYMYKSCFICATQMTFFIPDPSAPFYSTFWGPQGKEANQALHLITLPQRGARRRRNLLLPAASCQTIHLDRL